MRIAGLIILFHPSPSVLINIQSYLPLIDKLIVFDNTEIPDALIHQQIQQLPNVILIHDYENKGIAARLNAGAHMCINENFTWLLTMDQDSFFEESIFKEYLNCLAKFENSNSMAMAGVEYVRRTERNDCNYKAVKLLITSGSLVNLRLFQTLGGFDEALFIDDVDTDYCFNAITKGYEIIKFENIYLNHSLGNESYHTSLKSFRVTNRSLHSPLRLYYMVRNFLYINNKYVNSIILEEKQNKKKDLLNRIKNNFLYGQNRLTLLRFLLKGYIDFKRKKMGKKL